MEGGALRSSIGHRDADQDVVDAGLGVLDLNIEVAVGVEDAGVDQFKFGVGAGAANAWRTGRRKCGGGAETRTNTGASAGPARSCRLETEPGPA